MVAGLPPIYPGDVCIRKGSKPKKWGRCDNSGLPAMNLVRQYEYVGDILQWTGKMVAPEFYDEPDAQLIPKAPRGDPYPWPDMRPFPEYIMPPRPDLVTVKFGESTEEAIPNCILVKWGYLNDPNEPIPASFDEATAFMQPMPAIQYFIVSWQIFGQPETIKYNTDPNNPIVSELYPNYPWLNLPYTYNPKTMTFIIYPFNNYPIDYPVMPSVYTPGFLYEVAVCGVNFLPPEQEYPDYPGAPIILKPPKFNETAFKVARTLVQT